MAGVGAAPLSPPLQPRGRGDTGARRHGGAAAAGVPGAPGRPSLHRSPRAHWPRQGDHPGRRPRRAPPPPASRASPGRGGGRWPRPSQPSPLTEPGAQPSPPGHPPRRPRGRWFYPTARTRWGLSGWGGGPEAGEEGSRSFALCGESELQSPGGGVPPPLTAPRASAELAFGGSGKPSLPGVFPTPSALGSRLNLALVCRPLKIEKLVSKVIQLWKPVCAPDFWRECGLWY